VQVSIQHLLWHATVHVVIFISKFMHIGMSKEIVTLGVFLVALLNDGIVMTLMHHWSYHWKDTFTLRKDVNERM